MAGETMVYPQNIRSSKIRARNLSEFDLPLMITSYDPSKIEHLKNCFLVVKSSIFEGRKELCKVYGKRVRKENLGGGGGNGESAKKKKFKYDVNNPIDSTPKNVEKRNGVSVVVEEDRMFVQTPPLSQFFTNEIQDLRDDMISEEIDEPPPPNAAPVSKYELDIMAFINCPQLSWLRDLVANSVNNPNPKSPAASRSTSPNPSTTSTNPTNSNPNTKPSPNTSPNTNSNSSPSPNPNPNPNSNSNSNPSPNPNPNSNSNSNPNLPPHPPNPNTNNIPNPNSNSLSSSPGTNLNSNQIITNPTPGPNPTPNTNPNVENANSNLILSGTGNSNSNVSM